MNTLWNFGNSYGWGRLKTPEVKASDGKFPYKFMKLKGSLSKYNTLRKIQVNSIFNAGTGMDILKVAFVTYYQHFQYEISIRPVYKTLSNDEYLDMVGLPVSFFTFLGKVSVVAMGMNESLMEGIFSQFKIDAPFGNNKKRSVKEAATKYLQKHILSKKKSQIYSDFKIIWPSVDIFLKKDLEKQDKK